MNPHVTVKFVTLQTQDGLRPKFVSQCVEYDCVTLDDAKERAYQLAETLADLHLIGIGYSWVTENGMATTTILINRIARYDISFTIG